MKELRVVAHEELQFERLTKSQLLERIKTHGSAEIWDEVDKETVYIALNAMNYGWLTNQHTRKKFWVLRRALYKSDLRETLVTV
jgi:hypothetical protein